MQLYCILMLSNQLTLNDIHFHLCVETVYYNGRDKMMNKRKMIDCEKILLKFLYVLRKPLYQFHNRFCHFNFLLLPLYRTRHKGNRGNYMARCISDYDTLRLNIFSTVLERENYSHVKCVKNDVFSPHEIFFVCVMRSVTYTQQTIKQNE